MKVIIRLMLACCAYLVAPAFSANSDQQPADPSSQSAPATATPAASAQAVAQESTAAGASPTAQQTSTASSTGASDPQKKATKTALVDSTMTDAQIKQILAKGYKPEAHGDQVIYCRKEAQLGTRFTTKTCQTATGILDQETWAKDATERAQRLGGSTTSK